MASDPKSSTLRAFPADPAQLRIKIYPEPVLREVAQAIPLDQPEVRANVRAVAERMIDMMHRSEGIGLAAPQVGLPWRLFVVHIPVDGEERTDIDPPTATGTPVVYINPEISKPTGVPSPYEEGCLSLPDIRGFVLRPPVVTITATDLEGKVFTQTGDGLLARCWQHELDHLDGVLIFDRMTQSARLKCRRAIRDLEKLG
jgi:peptide deformylase